HCKFWFSLNISRKLAISSGSASLQLASIHSNSATLSVPFVKCMKVPFLIENLSICKASIISGPNRLRHADIVSFPEENTRSHGTADPWIAIKSIANENIVGK
ncbi:hypothetical protein BDQ12DRAFT_746223, partial [Crucibulum laeve]